MRYKSNRRVWLIPMLILLLNADIFAKATRYNQQIIAILENDPTIEKAAHFLYQKHDTTSYVMKWNGNGYDRVEWNEATQTHDPIPDADPLPIGTREWTKTRIQVVGHGDIASGTPDTIGGFQARALARSIFSSTGLNAGDVGRISIVGCQQASQGRRGPEAPKYLKNLMLEMSNRGKTKTEASARSELVSVDSTGRKLTGELIITGSDQSPQTNLEWSHKKPSTKWVGKIVRGLAKYEAENNPAALLESHYYGILPESSDVYISSYDSTTSQLTNTYKVSDDEAFKWVDRVAGNTYTNIDQGRAPEVSRQIKTVDGTTIEKQVREFSGVGDLLKELHHYGESGPGARGGEKEHYRYGDLVLEMDPDTFYVRVKGVITSPTDSAEKTDKINAALDEVRTIPNDDYSSFRPNTGSTFFNDVNHWIDGEHNRIGLEAENVHNALTTTAMFLSESIRCFQNHITGMMSLDLAKNGFLSKEYFFDTHPMARGSTWQVTHEDRPRVKKTGLGMLRDTRARSETYPWHSSKLRANKKGFKEILSRMSRISKSWLSHVDNTELKGSRHLPPQATEEQFTGQGNLLSTIEDIGSVSPHSTQNLRGIELTNQLLSSPIMEPETKSIDTQLDEFSTAEDISSPVRTSIALANDHAYVSGIIKTQVELKEQQTGKQYEILPDSIVLGSRDGIRFQLQEKDHPSTRVRESVTIDKSKLSSSTLVEDLQSKANELQESPESGTSTINRGLAIYGITRGLAGSINAFENGNITQGVIGLTQSLHGIGELSGINRAIYKSAGKYLGKVLRNQVENLGETVSTIGGEEAGSVAKAAGGEVLSTVGDIGDFLEDVPIVGTAFGIYNIYEDFQQHSTLGYIDAGLDIAITGLSLLGPEAEPVVLALTFIRMGIDSFYNEISKELKALPDNATTSQKVTAVFKGIGEAFVDLFEEFSLPGQIYGAITNSQKLDDQYDKDRSFLNTLSNYHNYFTVIKEEGSGATEINFSGGSQSWNGGDITFVLGESGMSSLALESVNSNGDVVRDSHVVQTQGVTDIVMGIGESHSISFKKQTVKFLWFIPVHSRNLISGTSGERSTLHGTYYGNSRDNTFMAVQQLPQGSNLGYSLQDYHYRLFGKGGDDSFYLGPQHSYVEGNDGSDTYFVNSSSVYTEINNFAYDGETDYLILNLDYSRLFAARVGLDLHIHTSDRSHSILIHNWFHDVTYQHMVLKSGNVMFKVSATSTESVHLIPYAMTSTMATGPVTLDARESDFSQVITLIGSSHDDHLYGNDMDNHMNGGNGDDMLKGGEGKDTYTIDLNEGFDTIDNFAIDGKVDILFFAARYDEILASTGGVPNNLYIARIGSTGSQQTGAIIKNWFVNDNFRHLKIVSEDGVVLDIPSTRVQIETLQPILVDMSLNEERRINLTSDSHLANVITVIGSDQDDSIIGNSKDNYMSAGKGHDKLEGKDGRDVYVVKAGDGNNRIKNFARDGSIDTLLFDARFDDILLTANVSDLILTAHKFVPLKKIVVKLKQWFSGERFQHLVVRSADGVVFELPTSTLSNVKTAKIIDYSNLTANVDLTLSGRWSAVERVLGSQGNDTIIGNSLSNYIDPGNGTCEIRGKNGSDTYVIRNYGKGNLIHNHALDHIPDTILFDFPFFSIDAKVRNNRDIQLTSITGRGHTNARLKDYVNRPQNQHLTVISEDGFHFVLPAVKGYQPVPIILNKADATTGQHINLTANSTFSEIRTVYGASKYPNFIIGNRQNNSLIGGEKADLLRGHRGNDVLKGGAGNDTLIGGPGADTLVGGPGNDRLEGSNGDDILSPGLGTNYVDGGNGTDTVIYAGNITSQTGIHLDLKRNKCIHEDSVEDTLIGVENAYGTEFDDMLQGDDEDNVLMGLAGDDDLVPGSGYDVLNGGNGNDTYDLSAANGTVILQNYATDGALDKVVMTYTNTTNLAFAKVGSDLVVRVIDTQYPVFYDGTKPTVVFKRWYEDEMKYQHAYIQTASGRIILRDLKRHARSAQGRAA